MPAKKPALTFASPTVVSAFEDGEIVRMTTYSESGTPDLRRGIRLARAAYEGRRKRAPPALTSVSFESAEGHALLGHTISEIAAVAAEEGLAFAREPTLVEPAQAERDERAIEHLHSQVNEQNISGDDFLSGVAESDL